MRTKLLALSGLMLAVGALATACGDDDNGGGGDGVDAGGSSTGGTSTGGTSTGGTSTGGTSTGGGGAGGFSFDAGPAEALVTDPACQEFMVDFAGQMLTLPGCCDPSGVCGAYVQQLSQCFTPSDAQQFMLDAGPSIPCGGGEGGAPEGGGPDASGPDASGDASVQDAASEGG